MLGVGLPHDPQAPRQFARDRDLRHGRRFVVPGRPPPTGVGRLAVARAPRVGIVGRVRFWQWPSVMKRQFSHAKERNRGSAESGAGWPRCLSSAIACSPSTIHRHELAACVSSGAERGRIGDWYAPEPRETVKPMPPRTMPIPENFGASVVPSTPAER